MNAKIIIVGVVAFILGGWFAYVATIKQYAVPEEKVESHTHEEVVAKPADMHMEVYNVPTGTPAPTITLEAKKDSKQGWNLHLKTTNFTFTPENAGEPNVPGKGHAHIFVDGTKIGRVYGNWFYLGSLSEGSHEITVKLATNDHQDYAIAGKRIESTATVNTLVPTPGTN